MDNRDENDCQMETCFERNVQEFDSDHVLSKFDSAFVSGHLAEVLFAHWAEYVPYVYKAVVNIDAASEERKANKFLLKPLERFICSGDPDCVFKQLKEFDKPPLLCGKSFKLGEPTFSCRDCGTDPTCVLCVECFQHSCHRQHNYRMSTSGGGGYCDCGDSEAWKSDPFCDIHKKGLLHQEEQSSHNSVENLPADIRLRASAIFELTVNYIIKMLKWTDCVKLPDELQSPGNSSRPEHFVTMLFNDETHTYEQVIQTLQKAVSCQLKVAIDFATTVDREGRAIVKSGSFTECDSAKKIIERYTSRGAQSKPLKVHVMSDVVVAHQMFAMNLLTWLEQLIGYSDGIRQLFTVHSLAPTIRPDQHEFCCDILPFLPSGSSEILSVCEVVMLSDTQLWKAARVNSHRLFMAGILMDPECKKQFAIMFTKMYCRLMDMFVQDDHDHSVSAVSESVQLFTVPTLARLLVADYGLMQIILEAFDSYCSSRLDSHGKLMFDRNERNSSFSRAHYMLIDLRYILTNRPMNNTEWTPSLRESFLVGYSSLLKLLNRIQGMNGVVRQTSQHVEYEPEWESAFNLQMKLSDILTILLDWCSSDVEVCQAAYDKTLACLMANNVSVRRHPLITVCVGDHSTACAPCDFTTFPISVHLPLIRLLAGLYVLVPEIPEYFQVDELMEPCLHCLVLVAQVQAGMWRRNGYSLQSQVFYYQNVRFRGEMFDKDIIMMQIAASMMDSNQFMIYLLYKFGLTNWIRSDYDTMVSQDDSVKQIIMLAEHFLLLILTCICERYSPNIGQDVDATMSLRRDIIHLLCLHPMAHSELVKAVPDDPYDRETNIEGIVQQVADFRKPQGVSGKGLYELKQDCYPEYTPYYYHYSRTEQAKSEEFVRKTRKQSLNGAALIPPKLPRFTKRFRRIVGLLNCDIMISIMQLVLSRSTAKYSKSFSESQFEMVLYLIALALQHEQESISDDDGSFDFVHKSKIGDQQSICSLLETLSNHANVSHQGQKDMINYIMKTMCEIGRKRDISIGPMISFLPSHSAQVSTGGTSMGESKLDRENRKKRELAAKRRERIMSQMARMQRNFIRENRELFETTSSENSLASFDDSGSEAQHDETTTSATPVAVGSCRTPSPSLPLRYTCILCQEEQDISHSDRALVLCAFVTRSTVLSKNHKSSAGSSVTADPMFMSSEISQGTYISACGHVMHGDCWRRFFEALVAKETRRGLRFRMQQTSFDISKNEFLCPLCETISNTVLPLMPSLHCLVAKDSSARPVEPELSLSDWLDGIQKTVQHSVQQRIDQESKEESFLFVPCPLSSVTKMMTDSVARNFQLLFDYVCDDPSAHFSDSITDSLKKFCTDVYATGLGVLPDDENVNVPVMVWMACAYTIVTQEHCLRLDDKPLFGALPSRQLDCVSALVRLAAVSGHVSTTGIVKQHCVTLLAALVGRDSVDGGRTLDARNHCILDFDLFHHLVALCLSLPALYADDDSARKQLHIASGRLNDLHALKVTFVAHVVKTMATASFCLQEDELMDTEDLLDDSELDEARNLYTIYVDIMNRFRDIKPVEMSPTSLLMYVRRSCLQFLRSAALFFHFLTNVAAPNQLTKNCSPEVQFESICKYLGLSTSLSELLTESGAFNHLIHRWCSDSIMQHKMNALRDGSVSLGQPMKMNHLLELPYDYAELINRVSSFTCPNTDGGESRFPAMCLVCGAIVCSQNYCCQTDIEEGITVGAATAHTYSCGAGTGIFLRVKECQILLMSGHTKGCFLPAPYLDNYGETDQGLKRGNPLHLCQERYQKLQKLWLMHGIPEEIVHLLESNNSLINVEWNHM